MSALRQAIFVARQDIGVMVRQKETLLWVFLMPIVFFYFIGTVTGGFGGSSGDEAVPVVLSAPPGLVADELEHRLAAQGFEVRRGAEAEATRRIEVVPLEEDAENGAQPSFDAAVLDGERALVRFSGDTDDPAGERDLVRAGRAVYGLVADLAVAAQREVAPTPELFRALETEPRALELDVRPAGRREDPPEGFDQAVPGILVMFTMLVLLTSGSVLLVIEREQGLLRRLASTPIPRGAVVLGKWLARMALGLVQIAFAALAGTLLFGMDWGSAPGAVAVLLVAWAAFNASLGILLANLARSTGQMTGLGVIASMVLAALGGCWWPIEITPPAMQRLALVLPTGWAMDALHKLTSFGYGAESAVPYVAALAGGAVVLGVAAARTFRYA